MSHSDLAPKILPPPTGSPPALAFLVEGPGRQTFHAYKEAHAAVTATVVLYDRSRERYLLTRRNRPPFEGQFVFPGGFLEIGQESLEETAARELAEEALVQVRPADLVLIDVRSRPNRDPRDHVVDVGYYAEVDRAEAREGDGVCEIRWATAAELDALPLGFDHATLWRNARTKTGR